MPQQVADRRDQDLIIWEQMQSEEIPKNQNCKEFSRQTCLFSGGQENGKQTLAAAL